MIRQSILFVLILFAASAVLADEKKPPAKAETKPAATSPEVDRETREKQFAEKLSGAVLVGHFTVDGRNSTGKPERYEIQKISKLREGYWVFNARVKYGENDVTVPMTLPIVWAGDTPMISMTDLAIPGLGTFTCRVFFYGDRYAGTWQHGKVGGHMWGMIERADGDGEKKEGDKNEKPADKKDAAKKNGTE